MFYRTPTVDGGWMHFPVSISILALTWNFVMALRAFHCNPSLGGFGNETESNPLHPKAAESGDAFAQIVKELVDNAVDACTSTTTTISASHHDCQLASNKRQNKRSSLKRVRVSMEKIESANGTVEDDKGDEGSRNRNISPALTRNRSDLLRLTICDNGCGMKDIEKSVSAFSSSKIDGGSKAGAQKDPDTMSKETAGRYGVGLTLCLLHAQRLVPNSCAMIKSTIENSLTWTVAKFVVDTDRDSVICVQKKILPKKEKSMSGTAVSLLLPGGKEAKRAWPRLAEYFARFQLSLGLKCSLEVMAPSLSRLPLFIRPAYEAEHNESKKERKFTECTSESSPRVSNEIGRIEDEKADAGEEATIPQAVNISNQTPNSDGFTDLLDQPHDQSSPIECNQIENIDNLKETELSKKRDHEGWHMEMDEEFFSSSAGPRLATFAVQPIEAGKKKDDKSTKRRMQMQKSASSYLKKNISIINVAHSQQRIKRDGTDWTKASNGGPKLEVDVIVSDPDVDEYGLDDYEKNPIENSTSNRDTIDHSKAKIMLIRMVNKIPMLDGAEASACGVVRGLQQRSLWNAFGLEIAPVCTVSPSASVQQALHVPTFSLDDSANVAPFFSRSNTHEMYSGDEYSEDEDYDSDDPEHLFNNRRKRKKRQKIALRPAGLRLGNIIIVVQLNAKSSQLPLPTLSKGRLPMNDVAINTALQAGLNACLRSLQKTNPSLLLTPAQLKKTERDVLYIPSLASALSSLILNCNDDALKEDWLSKFDCRRNTATQNEVDTRNTSVDISEAQLGNCLENRIRLSIVNHERERKIEALDKQKLRKKAKASKRAREHSDSLSVSSSQYDLDSFIIPGDTSVDRNSTRIIPPSIGANVGLDPSTSDGEMNSNFSPRREKPSLPNSCPDPSESEDDLKSAFSNQSFVSRNGDMNYSSSPDDARKEKPSPKNINTFPDPSESEDDMKSTFSNQSLVSQNDSGRNCTISVGNEAKMNLSLPKNIDMDPDPSECEEDSKSTFSNQSLVSNPIHFSNQSNFNFNGDNGWL